MNGVYKKELRTKRFVLLFSEYWRGIYGKKGSILRVSLSWHEYDTLEEAEEEIKLIKEVYRDQLIPIKDVEPGIELCQEGDITNGGKWWGYALLDYEKERVVRSGGYGYKFKSHMNPITMKSNKNLRFLDEFFRGPEEVPEGYEWDDGEYEGWLQFRWGDGKNAI